MAAREARLMLADNRALEEQAERMNPVNPKKQLGTRRGRTTLVQSSGSEYTGSGATPSMGLSQFRGGAMDASSDEDGEQLVGGAGLARCVGSGTKKGQMRKTARKAYEGDKSEAHEMGLHLSKHLQDLHGAGFWSDFKDGFMSVMRPVASIAKVAAPLIAPGAGSAVSAGLGALGFGKSGRYEGKGKLVITHGSGMLGRTQRAAPPAEPMEGSGRSRSARAALVKKIMSERGVSMIEASKIVKSEGLY